MLRACVVAIAVLTGCIDNEDPTPPTPLPSACVDSLEGCRAAGEACTWCAPIGAACTRAYVDLCGGGHGWCTEDAVCRQTCSPVDPQRCPSGTVVRYEADPERGADVCYCAPE